MGKKSSSTHESTIRPVICTKCGAKTVTNPGHKHRRCPAKLNAKPVPKGKMLGVAERGVWQ
jgi:hypothetical protein